MSARYLDSSTFEADITDRTQKAAILTAHLTTPNLLRTRLHFNLKALTDNWAVLKQDIVIARVDMIETLQDVMAGLETEVGTML